MDTTRSHEYVNDYLYFVIRIDKERGRSILKCCSGVNISRFAPITRGRHGIGSNPAMRGLQLIKLGVIDLALSNGARAVSIRGNECAGIAPTEDTWYAEFLTIENAPESFSDEIIGFCVINLLKKIFKAGMLEEQPPKTLLKPDELQEFLDTLCMKYSRV